MVSEEIIEEAAKEGIVPDKTGAVIRCKEISCDKVFSRQR
jgi:hypothetical protein